MSITRTDAPPSRVTDAACVGAGVIGPNAITRVAEALNLAVGTEVCEDVFAAASLERHLAHLPTEMVDEREVARLHRALIERLGPTEAANIAREAGRLTGDYLLANRIPAVAQLVLSLLPRKIAARTLVNAIARHAWTFAGSGEFSFAFSPALTLRLVDSPVCRGLRTSSPACDYFAATFERVFAAMLGPSTRVREIKCTATGAPACVFEVSW